MLGLKEESETDLERRQDIPKDWDRNKYFIPGNVYFGTGLGGVLRPTGDAGQQHRQGPGSRDQAQTATAQDAGAPRALSEQAVWGPAPRPLSGPGPRRRTEPRC